MNPDLKFHITLSDWETAKPKARALRYEIFVLEQQVPVELEWDEMDAQCLHAVALDPRGEPLGTGRLLPDGHIGRMAVRQAARGSGIGSAILAALMEQARLRGDPAVLLHAQLQAEEFYRRHGFVREGDPFDEAGIAHIRMQHRFI